MLRSDSQRQKRIMIEFSDFGAVVTNGFQSANFTADLLHIRTDRCVYFHNDLNEDRNHPRVVCGCVLQLSSSYHVSMLCFFSDLSSDRLM